MSSASSCGVWYRSLGCNDMAFRQIAARGLGTFGLICWGLTGASSQLLLLIPGLIAMPVFALIPSLNGQAVPLSRPGEEAKAASRGLSMFGMMILAFGIGGLGVAAWYAGVFWWFVLAELCVAGAIYFALCQVIARARWESAE